MTNEKENSEVCWIHLRMPEELGQAVETEARALFLTKSAFLRLLLNEYFKAKEEK